MPPRQAPSPVIIAVTPQSSDPVAHRVGGEAAEDDGVRRADAGAGEHRDDDLGDHPEVDRDAVALPDAAGAQPVGEAADPLVEVAVGDRRARSPGSPSQWKATRSPRSARWRSRQLTLAFSVPSANHVKNGGFDRSHALRGLRSPTSAARWSAEPEGLGVGRRLARRAPRGRSPAPRSPSDGGKRRSSSSRDVIVGPSLLMATSPRRTVRRVGTSYPSARSRGPRARGRPGPPLDSRHGLARRREDPLAGTPVVAGPPRLLPALDPAGAAAGDHRRPAEADGHRHRAALLAVAADLARAPRRGRRVGRAPALRDPLPA